MVFDRFRSAQALAGRSWRDCGIQRCVTRFALLVIVPFLESSFRLQTVAGEERHAALAAALETITVPELRQYVEVLSNDTFEGRAAGSRGGRAAAGYIIQALQRLGLKPAGRTPNTYIQPFGNQYQNLLAILEGSDPQLKHEYVLVGAHYDHVGYGSSKNSNGPIGFIHNGADDNGSGTAGLLEIVEGFTRLESRPRRSLLFAFWDCEENDLAGSDHWVREPTVPLRQISVALNLDMIGRLRQQLEVAGTRSSIGLRRLVSEQNPHNRLAIDFSWELKRNSDHFSFFAQGMPILFFHTGLHNDYHRPSDDAEKLNYEGLRDVAQLTFGITYALANDTNRLVFREASRREGPRVQAKFEHTLPAPPGRLGVSWDESDKLGPGLRILRVDRMSAADRAGLQVGDRIVEFAGIPLEPTTDLRPIVLSATNPVRVVLQRPGAEQSLVTNVTLTDEPVRVGISWREDEAEPGMLMIVQVVPGSPADQAGLRPLDRIYLVEGRPFVGSDDFQRRVGQAADQLQLTAERQGRLFEVTLALLKPHAVEKKPEENK